MLRSLLVGVLSMTALASCKGKEGGPSVQAGVAAGKVVELSGTVTAKRGSESRPLTSGTEVSGDDVIETGADSSVSIVLAHNNATWSLGPNKREKVADSLAWSLAKVDKPATGAIESTSAAGRHAEKAGANTSATAAAADQAKAEEPAAAPPQRTPPAPGGPPSPVAPPARPAVAAEPALDKTAPPPADSPAAAPTGGAALSEPMKNAKSGKGGGGDRLRRDNASPPPPPPPPPPPSPAPAVAKETAPEIELLATRERERLKACLSTSTPTLAVVLVVTNGKAVVQVPAGTPAAVKACLDGVAANMKPSAGLTDKLSLTLKR